MTDDGCKVNPQPVTRNLYAYNKTFSFFCCLIYELINTNNMKQNILFIVFLIGFSFQSLAYDNIGHRIVSDIAYQNLNCITRYKVDKVLGKRGMIYASVWSDNIRSDSAYSYSYNWHFQNLKDGMTQQELQYLLANPVSEGEHLFYAINLMTERLKKDKNDEEALKFLVHFTADLFQPMHLGRLSDRGGNDVTLKWFGRDIRLHQLWDTQMLEGQKFSYSEYSQYLQDKFAKQRKELKNQSKLDAIWETYLLRNKIYNYDYTNVSAYNYMYELNEDLDRQLFKAGMFLANLLNEIY